MTVLGDELQRKLNEKANDLNSFIWKGPKINGEQSEMKLIDATFEQLESFYKHCYQMLYNKDHKNPGRIVLYDIVNDQIQRCRAELLVRWLLSEKRYTSTMCIEDLRRVISNSEVKLTKDDLKSYSIDNVMNGLPIEFGRVPISLVMDACLDQLGIFDNSHLTLNFITNMGLWFTDQEMQNSIDKDGLYEKDIETGKAKNRLEVVRKLLRLDSNIKLKIKDTGLSFSEFKAMYRLMRNKYSNFTSEQLRVLSNKVLYRFQDQCEMQAKQWSDKMKEIIKVAEHKGWDVTRNIE